MSFLNKVWDDVMAGPQPDQGLDKLRNIRVLSSNLNTPAGEGLKLDRSLSMPTESGSPATPSTPTTPTTPSGFGRKDNVWRSVFHPGRNQNTRHIGTDIFDKPAHSNSPSPTVYDWLYSGETKSKHV